MVQRYEINAKVMALVCAAVMLLQSPCPCVAAGPAEQYILAQLQVVRALERRTDLLVATAEETASRLLQGGTIQLAGEPGMVAELLGRAGGLSAAKALDLDRPLPPLARDVVLWSDYGGAKKTDHGLARLAESGALVIAFASAENLSLGSSLRPGVRLIPLDIPGDGRLVLRSLGQKSLRGGPGDCDRPMGFHRRVDRRVPAARQAACRLPQHPSRRRTAALSANAGPDVRA